tara:strand:+ start:4589 stop:5017 length:429 start_codon:yes stop_codon:yes gene_type:complete
MNEYKKKIIIIFNMENIKYLVVDNIKKDTNTKFEDIIDCVEKEEKSNINKHNENNDNNENFTTIYYLLEEEYNEFTKKELERICDYYNISKRKKRKAELIQDIIIFEQDEINSEIVCTRNDLWYCIEQIKNDNYLKKFLILD